MRMHTHRIALQLHAPCCPSDARCPAASRQAMKAMRSKRIATSIHALSASFSFISGRASPPALPEHFAEDTADAFAT
eukprot:scaffold3218_cov99-Isochrysis_galbana.AAC.1